MHFLTAKFERRQKTEQSDDTHSGLPAPLALFALAFLQLIRFDYLLTHGRFSELYDAVRNSSLQLPCADTDTVKRITAAVDYASICYWKPVLCLQHSAATVCLLKRFGIPAQLVIGARQQPFKAHAWVEVNGCVVNDKPYTPEMFGVLDRC